MDKFKEIRKHLLSGDPLPYQHRDHPLLGEWSDHRECHIKSDWLLIYRIEQGIRKTLVLVRTGSHSDLFE